MDGWLCECSLVIMSDMLNYVSEGVAGIDDIHAVQSKRDKHCICEDYGRKNAV